jgi:hypothetical protein
MQSRAGEELDAVCFGTDGSPLLAPGAPVLEKEAAASR